MLPSPRACTLLLLTATAAGQSLSAIAGQAMIGTHAAQYLEELCDRVGGRVTGSPQARQAVAWAVEKMHTIGLQNVHTETWTLPLGWKRVLAEAELLTPVSRPLKVTSMGWVGSTLLGGLDAPVVAVNLNRLDDELTNNQSSWSGKVLLMVRKGGPPADPAAFLTAFGPFLNAAHAAHAAALIGGDGGSEVEGVNLTYTGDDGELCSPAGTCDAPIVTITREDQQQIQRYLDAGTLVRIKIDVKNQVAGPVESANVIGEIRGREHPEEVVVLSAHLDSWDLAQGATDDAFGVAAVLGAAEAILHSGQQPRRTIRFGLFTGEEQGQLGSQAYVKSHQAELPNHLAALVLDSGQGPIVRFSVGGHREWIPELQPLTASLAAFGALSIDDAVSLGTDCAPFILAGLPGINLAQDSPAYAATHHTEADTLDKVKPDVLLRDAAVMALAAFWIADRPSRPPSPWTAQQTTRMLLERKLDLRLKAFHRWPFDQ